MDPNPTVSDLRYAPLQDGKAFRAEIARLSGWVSVVTADRKQMARRLDEEIRARIRAEVEEGPGRAQKSRAQQGPQGGITWQQGLKDRAPHPEKTPQVRPQEDGQDVDKDRPGHTGGA